MIAPPLGEKAIVGLEVTKPPWQFVWLYALENIWVPFLVVAPLVLTLTLLVIPFVDRSDETHWKKRPVATLFMAIMVIGIIGLIIWGTVTTMTHEM